MSRLLNALDLLKKDKYEFALVLLHKLDRFNIGFILLDKIYLKIMFRQRMGYSLNLKNPKTFNEKIQWLKIHDRNPFYTTLVDKSAVKEYVSQKFGNQIVIPTLGIWDKFEEIDFETLPNQFVLKCTHDSQSTIVCKDKSTLNLRSVKEKITQCLGRNFYYKGREWPYKNVSPRVIAEKYMEDETGGFVDYKFFCFDGKVDCVMVCLDRHLSDTKFYFFDKDWKLKRLNIRGKNAPEGFSIRKPACMDEMFNIAAELSKGLSFVRVDLYECFGKIYFGEMTFYPDCGFDANLLPETDRYFGDLIDLNKAYRG